MNPYLLIDLGTTKYTFYFANTILWAQWPECEPISNTPPRTITAEAITVSPENRKKLMRCFINLRVDGELFYPPFIGEKDFILTDERELVWAPFLYPPTWMLDDTVRVRKLSTITPEWKQDVLLRQQIFNAFKQWEPPLPDQQDIINMMIYREWEQPHLEPFKPFVGESEIRVGMAVYKGEIWFAVQDAKELFKNVKDVISALKAIASTKFMDDPARNHWKRYEKYLMSEVIKIMQKP